jgi:hypothetical protein
MMHSAASLTVERLHPSGAWQITSSDDEGYLVVRTYYGYTKREAVRRFQAEIKER